MTVTGAMVVNINHRDDGLDGREKSIGDNQSGCESNGTRSLAHSLSYSLTYSFTHACGQLMSLTHALALMLTN